MPTPNMFIKKANEHANQANMHAKKANEHAKKAAANLRALVNHREVAGRISNANRNVGNRGLY